MANFIVIVDPDESRRRRFLRDVESVIAPVEGLRVDALQAGHFASVWAARHDAPVSTAISHAAAAVIWGDAIRGSQRDRAQARDILDQQQFRADGMHDVFDGFHAIVQYTPENGLRLTADLLGLFPVYYACRNGMLIAGASPELFARHPLFPPETSKEGIVGLLLTQSIFDGQSLLHGTRRLRPGHALCWKTGQDACEREHYTIPPNDPESENSFDEDVNRLESAFSATLQRHIPESRPAMLLSGGRDSRQLAGYMNELSPRFEALTFGDADDYDMTCASTVARELKLDHRVSPLEHAKLPAAAAVQAQWEHLASGFSNVHMWSAVPSLRDFPSHFVSAYLMDIRGVEPMPSEFDDVITGSKHRGIRLDELMKLLRRNVFAGIPESIFDRMKQVYLESSGVPSQRPWRFFLAHDWRCHAGGVPWKLAFGSWPVLPVLDRELLAVMFALPESSMANRRAQDEIIRRRFPRLARLPLDTNTDDRTPLLPSHIQRVNQRITRELAPLRRRIPRRMERRYYHRIYDINNPGWRAVRRMAEPFRERLADWFDMDAVRKLLPSPDEPIAVENKVRDSFVPKQLLGLMLWCARDSTHPSLRLT